jgi:hypothetical protein
MQTTISKSIALFAAVTHAVRMAQEPGLIVADGDNIAVELQGD